jgi:predicted nuclease with TOPRIM domain
MDMEEQRLNRIEAKLDGISQELKALVRVEEKQAAQTGRVNRLESRLDNMEDDLDEIKGLVRLNDKSAKSLERFSWLVIAAALSSAVYFIK